MGAILFLIVGFGSLVVAYALEGGHLGALLVGTAAMIVFGGTMGAVGLSFPLQDVKRFPMVFAKAFSEHRANLTQRIAQFIDVAGIVRREGVLALDNYVRTNEELDPLAKTGLQLVVDGTEPEVVREVLDSYLESTAERHKGGIAMLESAGGFAPTMGIIGTVMGLVHVLGNLSDPGKLGPSIAVAFIATLYGVASANLLWLPIGAKLKALDKIETQEARMIVEGVLLIGHGANPRIVAEKLQAFLEPGELEEFTGKFEVDRGKAA
jgi:chemotaxis protein MotA